MKAIEQLPLLMFFALTFMGNPAICASTSPMKGAGYKSFREWKTEKVDEIEGRLQQLKIQKESLKKNKDLASVSTPVSTEAGIGINLNEDPVERQIQQENLRMSLAQDLSVSDYFVGYLIKVENKGQAIKEISGRLSAEEVAELMNAYANSVFGTQNGATRVAPAALNFE